MGDLIVSLATGFGLGRSPVLPGTVGGLPGIILAWLILHTPLRIQLWSVAALLAVAVAVCHFASARMASADHSRIVADEFMSFPVTVIGQRFARNPAVLTVVFIASRLADGAKPPPAMQLQAIDGGVGLVLDDLVANLYVWLLLAGGAAGYRMFRRMKNPG